MYSTETPEVQREPQQICKVKRFLTKVNDF